MNPGGNQAKPGPALFRSCLMRKTALSGALAVDRPKSFGQIRPPLSPDHNPPFRPEKTKEPREGTDK
jgi:hypothetical protein